MKDKTPARQLVSIPEDSIEKRDDLEHILNKYWKMGLFQKTTTFPVLVYFPTTTFVKVSDQLWFWATWATVGRNGLAFGVFSKATFIS